MRMRTLGSAIVVTAGLATLCGLATAQAQKPSAADFEACNRQARVQLEGAGSGSALPRAGISGQGATGGAGTSSGAATSPGTSPGSPSGSAPPAATPSPGTGPTPGSGGATDQTLMGMDLSKQGDPAYQAAYRNCMKSRGF